MLTRMQAVVEPHDRRAGRTLPKLGTRGEGWVGLQAVLIATAFRTGARLFRGLLGAGS
jgi:hypothetical protein